MNLSRFCAVGLQCEAGSGGALISGSAMEGAVTFALMVHGSPKIHGLHEIIKSEVAGEWTLCFISAFLQAGHGWQSSPKHHSGSADPVAPISPQHRCPSAGLPSHLHWGARTHIPNSSTWEREHLQCPECSPACGTHVTPRPIPNVPSHPGLALPKSLPAFLGVEG